MKLDPKKVEALFTEATDQADYLLGLYRMVFPQWDDIEAIKGWPSINDRTWKAIASFAMDADNRFQKGETDDSRRYMAGGAWLNKGFSTSHGETLADWQVSHKGVELTMKAMDAVSA